MYRLEFDSIESLVERVSDVFDTVYENNENSDVSIIAKYDEAKQIIRELIASYGFYIHSIEINDEEYDNYYDEYIITLANIYGTKDIFCEPFKREDKYITDDSEATFVFEDCSSACLNKLTGNYVVEVGITEDEDTDLDTSDMESTYISRDKNSNPIGFQKTWSDTKDGISSYSSYSFYSSNSEELKKMADIYNVNL